jgi:hypothetical protein
VAEAVAAVDATAASQHEVVVGPRDLRPAFAAAIGELETVWLVLKGRRLVEERFCSRCAPSGDIWVVECSTGCGGGPLVVLGTDSVLPGMPADEAARSSVIAHLARGGWRIDERQMLCPACL